MRYHVLSMFLKAHSLLLERFLQNDKNIVVLLKCHQMTTACIYPSFLISLSSRDAIKHNSRQCLLHSSAPQAEKASQSLPLVRARHILAFSAPFWRVACYPPLIRHSVRTKAEKCTPATELCFVFGT